MSGVVRSTSGTCGGETGGKGGHFLSALAARCGRERILCSILFSVVFWKLFERGKYKAFQTRIRIKKVAKIFEKTQNCTIHRKTSSFSRLNNLVENINATDRFSSSRRYF